MNYELEKVPAVELWKKNRNTLIALSTQIQQVEDEKTLEKSGVLQTKLSKLLKELSKERLNLTRELDKVKKDIMSQEKILASDATAELDRLKDLNNKYATKLAEEARRVAEERARLEFEREQARIEAERKHQEALQAARAEQQKKEQDNPFGDSAKFKAPELPPEPEPVPEAPPMPEPVTAPKTSANKMVERWKFEIINDNQVPREFCAPDLKKIRAYMNYQKETGSTPEIPGVKFEKFVSVESK